MELNEYQERAMGTCLPESENFSYMMLGLVEKVGEFAGKVAEAVRKGELVVDDGELQVGERGSYSEWLELESALKKEMGDVMWMAAGLSRMMGWSLESVCEENLAGEGDDR